MLGFDGVKPIRDHRKRGEADVVEARRWGRLAGRHIVKVYRGSRRLMGQGDRSRCCVGRGVNEAHHVRTVRLRSIECAEFDWTVNLPTTDYRVGNVRGCARRIGKDGMQKRFYGLDVRGTEVL